MACKQWRIQVGLQGREASNDWLTVGLLNFLIRSSALNPTGNFELMLAKDCCYIFEERRLIESRWKEEDLRIDGTLCYLYVYYVNVVPVREKCGEPSLLRMIRLRARCNCNDDRR